MKEKPQLDIDYEKNIIDKDKFEVVITKYYIIPYIDGRIKGKYIPFIAGDMSFDSYELGVYKSKMIPLEKLDGKTVLPNKTIAFKMASKTIRKVYNNNKELLSTKKEKLQDYATIYFVGKKFKVDKEDPRKLMMYFNSQTNKYYPFRLGLTRVRGWHLYFSEESNYVFKPTLLEKLSERIL